MAVSLMLPGHQKGFGQRPREAVAHAHCFSAQAECNSGIRLQHLLVG